MKYEDVQVGMTVVMSLHLKAKVLAKEHTHQKCDVPGCQCEGGIARLEFVEVPERSGFNRDGIWWEAVEGLEPCDGHT